MTTTQFLSIARQSLQEAEKAMAEAIAERKAFEDRLQSAEAHIRDLETRLESENRDNSDMELFRRRITEEMEEERDQHQKDLAERDFTIDQTRKKYQSMI